MEATARNGGSISHHHGIGFWRKRFMEQEVGSSGVDTLGRIRRSLDPKGILNRGKLVDDGR
jgi:FAD/FMN-containing dehydrogenase